MHSAAESTLSHGVYSNQVHLPSHDFYKMPWNKHSLKERKGFMMIKDNNIEL